MILCNKQNILLSISLLLAACYVVLRPPGWVGAALGMASLTLALAACNRDTLVAYLLLFGMMTIGPISIWIGVGGAGGKITGGVGLLLAITGRGFLAMIDRLQVSLLWVAWFFLVLTIWYMMGPRTEYCTTLLLRSLLSMVTAVIGYAYLLWKPSVDWRILGQATLVSAVALIGFWAMVDGSVRPSHLLDVAAFRPMDKDTDVEKSPIGAHNLAFLATMGAILMASAAPDRPLGRQDVTQLAAGLILAGTVVGWAFNRLHLVTFTGTVAVIPFTKPQYARRYRYIALFSVLLIAVAVVAAYLSESRLVMQVIAPDQSFGDRMNRSGNWNAGVLLIGQKPWLGHGLGGYYVPGYTSPGEKSFAHNIVLQLLVDLGVIGTFVAFAPMLVLIERKRHVFSRGLRSASGALAVPALLPVFLDSFGTGSYPDIVVVLALLAVLFASVPKELSNVQQLTPA